MTEQQKRTAGFAIAALVLGLFFWFPLLGVIFSILAVVFGILALSKISKSNGTLSGQGMAITGIVLGGVGIVMIPIIAILAAIAIPNLLKARIAANDSLAKSTLRTMMTASETYATANSGKYPLSEGDLLNVNPPYLAQSYCDQMLSGFLYSCKFREDGFQFNATPTTEHASGTKEFVVTNTNQAMLENNYR